MSKFRKKPVVIEALQYSGTPACGAHIVDWIWRFGYGAKNGPVNGLEIKTLETDKDGWFKVSAGDWVIRGVKGEFYACKPDIFEATYEAVE